MGVTVENVRVVLNRVPETVINSDTIQMFISKAEKTCTEKGIVDGDDWVQAYAAYYAWTRGYTYSEVKIADIKVKQDWEAKASILKKDMEDEWAKLSETYVIDSTPMFDQRPEDPYETGEIEYGEFD